MWIIGATLTRLGSHGPILLVTSLFAGVLIPPLAQIGYYLLPISAFLLTLGSFLTAGFSRSESRIRSSILASVLIWVGFVLPFAAAAIISLVPLNPSLRAGVLISLLAPPVGSAAAIAGMLGLEPRLALFVSIALTVLSPILMPYFAGLLGLGVSFDMSALAIRLCCIIGAAAFVAAPLLKWRIDLKSILPDQRAATGIAVIGLVIVGLATALAVEAHWIDNPRLFQRMLAAAIAINFGLCALTTLIFARFGLQTAGTVGLVSGNRNVTLVWAAASFGLPPLAEGYVAACVIPVLALPLIIKLCVRIRSWVYSPV